MFRILLGIDTDEDRAAAQAELVTSLPAAREEVTAVVTHVFQDNPEGASVQQLASVREAVGILEDAGVDYQYHEASGQPASEIIAAADEVDADMICVSGRKRTPTGKVVFGSVTQAVILGTERPVTTVRPAE